MPSFPSYRPRRFRRSDALRALVRETALRPEQLILPLFACSGSGVRREIPSMPGVAQCSVDELMREAEAALKAGVGGVILFGLPDRKDATGSSAWDADGPVSVALRALAKDLPGLVRIADVCLCEYTDHGHCGVWRNGQVDNDETLPLLARAASQYADAGADIVAPSDMMDGRVRAIRESLDAAGKGDVAILAYSAKYMSALYGPFREAAHSGAREGDRSGYQMDPGNGDEALREVRLDIAEGADAVMVKPAGPYLDIISRVKRETQYPVAAYQVSGEFAMIKAAGSLGWLDESRVMMESLLGIRRAGADVIITYFASQAARLLSDQRP